MPRKAGSSTRKTKVASVPEVPAQTAPVSVTAEVHVPEAVKTIAPEVAKDKDLVKVSGKDGSANGSKNGKSFAAAAASGGSVKTPSNGGATNGNLEDAIRHRAYEIYLQRAKNGQNAGDQNQDWLIAEREVRSRLAGSRTTRA
jgi:hypothetical protein